MSTRPLTELFGASADTRLTSDYINGLLAELQLRIGELQILKQGLDAAIAQAQDIALVRINEILGPATTAMVATLTELLETSEGALADAAAGALAAIQPQIDEAIEAVDAAIVLVAEARDQAVAAASAADDAVAGIDVAIAAHDVATTIATNTAAVAGDRLLVDTSSGAVVITLPAVPIVGQIVTIWRSGASAVTINRNGKTIAGIAQNLVIDVDQRGVRLTYLFGGWQAFPEVLA